MNFKTVSKEELELMPFDDIAYIVLKEKEHKMKVNEIFKIICDTLELGEKTYEDQIGDFFALLATEKRFIQLEKGFWDLRENHTSEISIKDIEDELTEEDLIDEEDPDSDDYDETKDSDEDSDEEEDDLKDLVIVDDLEEGNDL